ncbi:hypothetical protein F0562_022309 [Nyssa sinensis]|uniref:F-box domain-containing protein n=1 Tax=Nyssa sinensis TaxID=561372 RepID=A0A5J5BRG1_9ASTE|nr:hypothetical protein F0562_022309 [Nyssa sinensis]
MVSSSMTTTVDQGGGTTIFAIHPDILQTHILTRLDGPTLASAGCTSSQLHALSTEEKLWMDICNHKWPSTNHPRVHKLISTFTAGHRSFFSDSFPTLDPHHRPSQPNPHSSSFTSELIFAVDIHYQDKLIFSRVQEIETLTGWFLCSPFRVDYLCEKEIVPTPVRFECGEDTCRLNLEENLTLSCIVINPTRKRAANVSSLRPILVQRHWLTGEIQLQYTTILAGHQRGRSSEFVQCRMVVTCGRGGEGGELQVREVSLLTEDMDEKNLTGKESLLIFQKAVDSGGRKIGKRGEERESYVCRRKKIKNTGKDFISGYKFLYALGTE